jgi:hypothetical protein
MCDKFSFRPAKSTEDLMAMKQKIEQDKLEELKRQHEYMGFTKDNMR